MQNDARASALSAHGHACMRVTLVAVFFAAMAASAIGVLVAPSTAAAQALPPTRYEQDDTRILYAPAWTESPSGRFSGGTYRTLSGPGFAEICFNGNYFALIARMGPKFGIAKVRVDDQAPVLVDLYSPTTVYQGQAWSTWLGWGGHIVRIEWTGDQNALSTGSTIDIDAVDTYGDGLTQASRGEENDTSLLYVPAWATSSSGSFSGGTYHALSRSGFADIAFDGSAAELIARTGPKFGIAKVTLDNDAPEYVDLYSATTVYQAPVWCKGGLASGGHVVRIEWTGDSNPLSAANTINIDAIDIGGDGLATAGRFEQDDANLFYVPAWAESAAACFSGGSYRTLSGPGFADVAFDGNAVELVARTGPKLGIAKVTVDGDAPEFVDLYSQGTVYKAAVWRKAGLADGGHVVRVEWTGDQNPAAAGNSIDLDAIDVAGGRLTAAGRFEEDDWHLAYSTKWPVSSSNAYSGGTSRLLDGPGDVYFAFQGSAVELIARTGPKFGIAQVTIDGNPAETVDLYSQSSAYRVSVWRKAGLSNSAHYVRIEWTGNHNEAATGSAINLDAIDVAGGEIIYPFAE